MNSTSSTGGSNNTSANAFKWVAHDLGAYRCLALNSHRKVLGLDAQSASFLIDVNGAATPLPLPEANTVVVAQSMSDDDTIVGYSEGPKGRSPVMLTGSAWVSLPSLSGTAGAAVAINGTRIVGTKSGTTKGTIRGFSVVNGADEALALPLDKGSAIYGLSSAGHIVGVVETANGDTHAFVLNGQTFTDLGTLEGTNSSAYAVNAHGQVVGTAETSDGSTRAFLTTAGANLTRLDNDNPLAESDARGIDDDGFIAGNKIEKNGFSHPVVFMKNAVPIDLMPKDANGKFYLSAHALAMNAKGDIVGHGLRNDTKDSSVHCLLWTKEVAP